MKKFYSTINPLFGVLLGGLLLFGCQKDSDSDSPSTPDPSESKPSITIEKPIGKVSPLGNAVDLKIVFTDRVEMLSATIVMTSEAIFNGAYYSETRQLNGTSDEIAELIPLQQINMLGNHRITVAANNDNGKQEFIEQDFELVDEEDPTLNVMEFYSDLSSSPGTPHSKFNFKASDNYVLKSVKWFVYLTDSNGNEIVEAYFDEEVFTQFKSSFEYNEEFDPVFGNPGDYYKGVVEVEDLAGHKVRYDSQVMQFN